MILAVETATNSCSVALAREDKVFSRYLDNPSTRSQSILQMVDEVLKDASVKTEAIKSLAVTIGPGSFTGLRIGFSLIQGLALSLNIPVLGISTLEVMAANYKRTKGSNKGELIISVIDARMGEFAVGGYRWFHDGFTKEFDDCLLDEEGAQNLVRDHSPIAVVGEITGLFPAEQSVSFTCADLSPTALDLCELAKGHARRGLACSIRDLDLVYLRGSEAWTKRKKIR